MRHHVEQLVEQLTTEGVSYTYRDSISIDARYEHEYAADAATVHSIIKQLYQDYHDALSVLNIARVDVRTGKRVTYRYDAISKKVMIEESKQAARICSRHLYALRSGVTMVNPLL